MTRGFFSRVFAAALPLALGFGLAAVAVGHVTSYPAEPVLAAKLASFSRHSDEIDVLFLGNSRTYRGVVPAIFDEELHKNGLAWQSFNFGMGMMDAFEAHYLLRQIMAFHPRNLKYLVLASDSLVYPYTGPWEERLNPRFIYWRDFPETLGILSSWLRSNRPWEDRLSAMSDDVALFAYRFTSKGKLLERYGPDNPTPTSYLLDTIEKNRGYFAFTWEHLPEFKARAERFKAHPERWNENLEYFLSQNATSGVDSPESYAYRELLREARSYGLKIVLLAPPMSTFTFPLDCEGKNDCFRIGFSDRDRYPEFYRIENYFDHGHMNDATAPPYTREVARKFLRAAH